MLANAAVGRWWTDLPVPDPDAGDVRDKAREILSGRQFQPRERSWFERVLDWIGNQLERLFGAIGAGAGGSRALTWLFLLAAAGAVAWFFYRAYRSRLARAPKPEPFEDITVEERRSAAEWRAEAARFEQEGQWKQALRCRYRALLHDLIDEGLVDDIAGRTSGEYRRDVSTARPDVAASFGGVTDLFERAWYGDRPTGAAESERFQDLEAGVLAGARR